MAVRKVSVGRTKKRKKAAPARRTPTRRRRISGAGKLDVMDLLKKGGSVGAGVVGGRLLNAVIVKQMPTFSAMESGLVQFAAGGALAYFGSKNPYLSLAGYGLMGQAIAVEAVNAGLISGIGSMGNDRVSYRINGSGQTTLGSARRMSVINGGGQTRLGSAGNMSTINGAGDLSVINGKGKSRCV